MRTYPSESDLLHCANKTMYLHLCLKVKGQFLDGGEFISLILLVQAYCGQSSGLFLFMLLKKKLFMTLVHHGKEDFIPIETTSIGVETTAM